MAYNGYTNYETWRVFTDFISENEEITQSFIAETRDPISLAERIEEFVTKNIEEQAEGEEMSYALIFIRDVAFLGIAEDMLSEFNDYHCKNCLNDTEEDFCTKSCEEEYSATV